VLRHAAKKREGIGNKPSIFNRVFQMIVNFQIPHFESFPGQKDEMTTTWHKEYSLDAVSAGARNNLS
jgi:hypothetical protein